MDSVFNNPFIAVDRSIRVFEKNNKYLVTSPSRMKERASGISGRRWDRTLAAWVFLQTLQYYEALKSELKKELAVKYEFDRETYTEMKWSFIKSVLKC